MRFKILSNLLFNGQTFEKGREADLPDNNITGGLVKEGVLIIVKDEPEKTDYNVKEGRFSVELEKVEKPKRGRPKKVVKSN